MVKLTDTFLSRTRTVFGERDFLNSKFTGARVLTSSFRVRFTQVIGEFGQSSWMELGRNFAEKKNEFLGCCNFYSKKISTNTKRQQF